MKHLLLCILIALATFSVHAQTTKKVLFIGNSYTGANDLPLLINNMAESTGDVLIYDANIPGGARLMDHAVNPTTLNKINSDNWDYVVLQAQSQETALSETQMETEVYPYAESLSNAIRENNACAQPMFYMTWGRENGDPINCEYLPWMCSYEEMDDVISATYTSMTESNEAKLAAVGKVWRYLIENQPSLHLYANDGSHPSLTGSYVAAAVFYTMIYKKDPTEITWNADLSENDAETIKMATKTIVFDTLSDWDFTQSPVADYSEVIDGSQVTFTNTSSSFEDVLWDFGDSNTSSESNPVHTYTESGRYEVSLTISKCDITSTKSKTIDVTVLSVNDFDFETISIYPNPTSGKLIIKQDNTFKNAEIILSDLSGKSILSTSADSSNELIIDLSHLNKGVYLLSITTDENSYVKKIIKK